MLLKPRLVFFHLALLLLTLEAQAARNPLCEILDMESCAGVNRQSRRASAQSLPSAATATQFNPANVTHDRGVGVETIYQFGQNPSFSFVTGTGKAGAALVSPKLENTFFSNSLPELDYEFFERQKETDQYVSDKLSFAISAALFKNRTVSFDLGLMAKYHPDVKKVQPGAGLSFRVGVISLGASFYQDDLFFKFKDQNAWRGERYADIYQSAEYQETFKVQSYFAGVKIKDLFLDTGIIKTRYDFTNNDMNINIYSASYIWRSFMLNMAMRQEESNLPVLDGDELKWKEKKTDYYAGLQYSIKKAIILGVHYNYYRLKEVAAGLTLFL